MVEDDDQAPHPDRRIEQLRALLARLEADGTADGLPARAVRSLLEEAAPPRDHPPEP